MAAHPDGSGRVFLSTQDGKIWLAPVPARGSGATLRVDHGTGPFLDLADRVHHDAAQGLGLVGVAFHPRFATNGRFFASYTCDSASPACAAAGGGNGSRPWRYGLVVAEFAAEEGGGNYSKASRADPSEVRRVFTMALPQQSHTSDNQHGGQILFRPTGSGDGYLYLIAGHGGDEDFSKDKRPFYGKILRIDVDHSTPPMDRQPETLALRLNNPSGCSFDSESPSDLYCGNTDQYEQVYLISNKSGNYGAASANAAVSLVIRHGRPTGGSAPSILGGLVYRGSADPWLEGRYLYMYGSTAWVAEVTPESSTGLYASARVPNIRCSRSSPVPCPGGSIGSVLSFGEDNSKDAFALTTEGPYKVVQPGLCGGAPPPPPQSAPGLAWLLSFGACAVVLAFYQVYMKIFAGGGGQPVTICNPLSCDAIR